MISSDLPGGVF